VVISAVLGADLSRSAVRIIAPYPRHGRVREPGVFHRNPSRRLGGGRSLQNRWLGSSQACLGQPDLTAAARRYWTRAEGPFGVPREPLQPTFRA